MSPVFLAIVVVPAAVAGVSAFIGARNVGRLALTAAVGLVLAGAFVLVVYLRAPSAHAPRGCSDCGLYLGRWWEPSVVAVVATFGLAAGSAAHSPERQRDVYWAVGNGFFARRPPRQ